MRLDWDNLPSWKVLIVEDEPDNAEVVSLALLLHGITAHIAIDGMAALQMLESLTPDLILLDLSMPKMNGWETFDQLKLNPRTQSIPVVALSAHAMAGDQERVLEKGFDGYLSKPISVANFMRDLRATLEEPKPDKVPTETESTKHGLKSLKLGLDSDSLLSQAKEAHL